MKWFSKLFSKKQAEETDEQAVVLHIKVSGEEFGDEDERMNCYELEDQLIEKLASSQYGEVDGHEFANGYFIIYMYAPDANRLYEMIENDIRKASPAAESYVVIRNGQVGAKEEKIIL